MTHWFTADQHWEHRNIIAYCNRLFKDVDEMNYEMVRRWNDRVQPEDTVYHLGDFTLGGMQSFNRWANQLNGYIHILPGSHDHIWIAESRYIPIENPRVSVVAPLVSLEFPRLGVGKYPLVLVLCHYSMNRWDRSHYGSKHIFAHSHGDERGIGMSFDVGVDCTNFAPMSLDEVLAKFKKMEKK